LIEWDFGLIGRVRILAVQSAAGGKVIFQDKAAWVGEFKGVHVQVQV
jgi:hypothetical protein